MSIIRLYTATFDEIKANLLIPIEKMKGIEKIKDTFRTDTGKRYGPEFIDQGISIGNAINTEMNEMLQRGE